MGYTYNIDNGHFVMEKPENHDFLFWNAIPVLGMVDSATGVVTWYQDEDFGG